jgi:hypothetical protein
VGPLGVVPVHPFQSGGFDLADVVSARALS